MTIARTSVVRTLIQDLRFGLRMALRSPGFTLIAVLTLAAGIAANSTVFSWIDGVLLHPVPGVADPARLVAFETVAPNGDALATSYPDYRDYRDRLKLVDGLAGATMLPFGVGQDVHAEHVWGELSPAIILRCSASNQSLAECSRPMSMATRRGPTPFW